MSYPTIKQHGKSEPCIAETTDTHLRVAQLRPRGTVSFLSRCGWGFATLSLTLIGIAGSMADDRQPLDHESYDKWASVSAQSVSDDGQWISYQTTRGIGDDAERKLFVRSTRSDVERIIERGRNATFTPDSQHLLLIVDPSPADVKKAVDSKLPESQRPQPKLVILELATGKMRATEGVRSFRIPEKHVDWIGYQVQSSPTVELEKRENELETGMVPKTNSAGITTLVKLLATAPAESNEKKPETKGKPSGSPAVAATTVAGSGSNRPTRGTNSNRNASRTGSTLVIEQLSTGMQWRFPNVIEFQFSKEGHQLGWITSDDDSTRNGIWVAALASPLQPRAIAVGTGKYDSLAFDEPGTQLAYTHQPEAEKDQKATWSVGWCPLVEEPAPKIVAASGMPGIPDGWQIQASSPLNFSKSGKRLFFNTTPKTEEEDKKAEPAKDEPPKAQLDVWHWSEPLLQTVQQVQVNRLRQENYRAVCHLEREAIVQLAMPDTPNVQIADRDDSRYGISVTSEPYRVEQTWEVPGYSDVWLIDIESGRRQKVVEKTLARVQISPAGQYVYWWDGLQSQWFGMSTRTKKTEDWTRLIPQSLSDHEHDTPNVPNSYGAVGWTEKDRHFWIYDRYDLWQVDPSGKAPPVCITQGMGRTRQIRLRRQRLDSEEEFLPRTGSHLLSAFSETDKRSGYFDLTVGSDNQIEETLLLPESVDLVAKAKHATTILLSRQDFRSYPDLWATDLEFQTFTRLSKVNPQQNDYRWGTAELVAWNSSKGQPLQGILYKPDNFDPNTKYPMIVYYYERNSDNLHRYYAPAPGRSIINFSFYVSRGYLVFVPDIVYEAGAPGPSAMDCIMPGVDHLIAQGFVDADRMGLQGHSWGGYQTAYLVTQTDRFAAAEAGAPVSNMTSAYGGIRWQTGLSRMFQYERTQSRIGKTLWEDREAYILNSPLFFADRIQTPLLILHNDNDGAVPWYQGIELFMAMRRLGKPAWLINYNGEPHGITKEENRRDFTIRMQQFFDHYLQDAPAPRWMVTGVPATEKGKTWGLELVPDPPAIEPPSSK